MTLTSAFVMAGLILPASATDTMPWQGGQAAGANQPYQHGYTGLDLLNWNPAADHDAAELRSRVPLQDRIEPMAATQKYPELATDTEMFNLAGDYGNAFFESFHDNNVFSQFLFNYWQYTDFYGTWHGMASQDMSKDLYDETAQADWTQKWFEFGMLNLPNAAYTNAAHKNGVKSIATIFFSGSDRGEQTYKDLLQGQRENGTFPVADKLVEVARYFGFDGYFINQESSVDGSDVESYRDFIKQVTDQGIYIQWYDSAIYPGGGVSYQNAFNGRNSPWVYAEDKGKVSDSIFLNYWFNNAMLKNSAEHAIGLGIDPKQTVFAGIEAGQKKFGSISANASYMNANLGADGSTFVSIAALGTDFVSHELGDAKKIDPAYQNEVFDRERRLWTGSSTGEAGTTDIADGYIDDGTSTDGWKGFASQIAERSVIDGTSFSTTFNTGHGLEWVEGGQVSSEEEWGNINLQDILPTWQWRVDADADPLQIDFDYGDEYVHAPRFSYHAVGAYEGGSSLVISGPLSATNTIRLYKTDLDVVDGSKISLTYQKQASDESDLALGLVFDDAPSTVVSVPLADGAATEGWRTVSADLAAFAGRNIATIGLVVDGTSDAFQVNLGELALTDGADHTPAAPTGLAIDRYLADTGELTVSWDLADYDTTTNYLLYLDDQFLGGRYDETLYIKKLPAPDGTLRLVAVGPDGSRSEAATVELNGTNAATGIQVDPTDDGKATVTWTAPAGAKETSVTLSTDSGSWRYANVPFSATLSPEKGNSTVTFEGVPADGSRFVADVVTDGNISTATGVFADATLEPYPLCDVSWSSDGTRVTLVRPSTQDWRYLRVTERWEADGQTKEEAKTFSYTYTGSAGPGGSANDKVIRGRTTASAYTVRLAHAGELLISVEDYNGNVSDPLAIPSAGSLESCTWDAGTGPSSATSTVTAPPASIVADGESTAEITAAIKDSFGNPLTDQTVSFTLPESVSPVEGVDPARVAVDSRGIATIAVTSQTAGTVSVPTAVGGVNLGSVDIEFMPADTTAPMVTVKDGADFTVGTAEDGYELVSFKLYDEGKIDRVSLNGMVKDLSDSLWSDFNFVKPGSFGGVLGKNTLEVFDVAGNVTTVEFILVEAAPSAPVWDKDTSYTNGDAVSHQGRTFIALWWTRGEEPGTTPTGAWSEVGAVVPDAGEHVRAWTESTVYTGGDVVAHDGHTWAAKWWTRNQEPGGASSPWQDLGEY